MVSVGRKGYSTDLRRVGLEMLDAGHSQTHVSRVLGVCRKTVYHWLERFKKTGSFAAKQVSLRRSKVIRDLDEFQSFVDAKPERTLKEFAQDYGRGATPAMVAVALKKIGYTHKKKLWVTKNVSKRNAKSFKKS